MAKKNKRRITYYLWQLEKIATAVLAIFAVIAIIKGEKLMMLADEQSDMLFQAERISLEHQIQHDLECMEVPQHLLEPDPIYISEKDMWLLAQAMYAEEGVYYHKYSKEDAELVHKLAGSVIVNRKDVQYRGAETIEEVIFAKGQYALQTQQRVRNGQDIPDEIYEWAIELLAHGAIAPKGMIYQSESDQGEPYMVIGNQHFGVDPKYN